MKWTIIVNFYHWWNIKRHWSMNCRENPIKPFNESLFLNFMISWYVHYHARSITINLSLILFGTQDRTEIRIDWYDFSSIGNDILPQWFHFWEVRSSMLDASCMWRVMPVILIFDELSIGNDLGLDWHIPNSSWVLLQNYFEFNFFHCPDRFFTVGQWNTFPTSLSVSNE